MTLQQFVDELRSRAAKIGNLVAVGIVKPSYTELPIDLAGLLGALLLTIALLAIMNWSAGREVEHAYLNQTPAPLTGVAKSSDTATVLIARGWAEEPLRGWLPEVIEPGRPTHQLILDVLHSLASVARPIASVARPIDPAEATLHRLGTGDPSGGFPPPLVFYRGVSGPEILEAILNNPADRGVLNQGLDSSKNKEEIRAFLNRLCEDLSSGVRPPIRGIRRWNGFCQWLTVAIAMFVLIALARRAYRIFELSKAVVSDTLTGLDPDLDAVARTLGAGRDAGASLAERTMLSQEESNRLADAVETRVYEPLHFLIGCLPSLGFIGTVIGMGEALLLADSLFGSADRQRTISLMTEQLGFAFDTTLVALLCGLFASAALAIVQRQDRGFVAKAEAATFRRFVDPGEAAR